ncbi:MAG: response regulator transcription factor [Caldilinea sp.]|nr:response regulator transcription factor [Caldilinea sp.]MCB0068233.1 response regulator transcription factor [Caldilineaceae bacterium]MCB0052604.1 response regulator transcription factor [Caldilinea sp.]MCB0134545.1 response regulator transcription factor [Caldilineaceae bacterium]MCB9115896.1 response regulator transcription factor [Caldilineaceae bacterium]
MSAIRVLLADDHAVVRQGIRDFLEEEADIVVVAEAADGASARRQIEDHLPDVAVLDIRMPNASGIDVVRWATEQGLPVRMLILTAYDDDPFVLAAMEAGASGYVLKNADASQIVSAVRAVAAGQVAIGAEAARALVTQLAGASANHVEALTDREIDVLKLAAEGLTNRGIGRQLSISDRTVQGHLANIYAKLGVASRTEAVTKALQLGWIELSGSKL